MPGWRKPVTRTPGVFKPVSVWLLWAFWVQMLLIFYLKRFKAEYPSPGVLIKERNVMIYL